MLKPQRNRNGNKEDAVAGSAIAVDLVEMAGEASDHN